MSPENWENRLWSLANAITGFALAQSLTAAYAFGKGGLGVESFGPTTIDIIIGLGILVQAAQIYAVVYCKNRAIDIILDSKEILTVAPNAADQIRMWKITTRGRIVALIAFAIVGGLGLILQSPMSDSIILRTDPVT